MAATFMVIGIPTLAVSALRASGEITSLVALIVVAVVLSVGASYLGAAVWATRKGSKDVLFADLMLWGWMRRWRAERQLASAVRLLGLRESAGDPPAQLNSSRRVRLLRQLAAGLEARYPDTHGHSRRVARHAGAVAKRMGLPREEVVRIRTAAAVHDVGKIDIPAAIVEKPGKLTDAEFAVVKRHPEIGAQTVDGLDDEELTRIVRHHHERLDGRGYPDGLAGAQIPLGARIIAVADTFDAVTSTRPYRSAKSHKEALGLLAAEAGTQLDPEAVRAFRRYYSGHRPVLIWALLLNALRQLIASLAGQTKLAGVVTATTLATVAAGNVAITAPKADQRVAVPRASDVVATRFADPGKGGAAGANAGGVRLHSSDTGQGTERGSRGDGAPASEGGSPSGADAPPAANQSGPAANGGGSDRGSGGESSRGDDGSGGDGGSSIRDSTEQIVSDVTAPIDSTVDVVARTVESIARDGDLPIVGTPDDVRSVVPSLPLPGLGGR